MSEAIYLFIIAAVLILLIPLVPRLLAFRIRALRFLHLRSLADWHVRHFGGVILGIRIGIVIVAAALIYVAVDRL